MAIEIGRLDEIISYLETKPEITMNPYPEYDGRINELLTSLDIDADYQENFEKISDKDAQSLSLSEIKTYYTFILRGERFCDGHIAAYVEDGTVLKLAQRQRELISD